LNDVKNSLVSDPSDGGLRCGDDGDLVWKLVKSEFQRVGMSQLSLVAY
jgi:hypothetical protein